MSKIILKDSSDDLTLQKEKESIDVFNSTSTIDEVVAAALVDLDKRLKALEQAYNNQ